MKPAVKLILPNVMTAGGGGPFAQTAAILGAGGLDYAFYDSSAFDRMWQDNLGTTAAAVASPVGQIIGREKQSSKTLAQVMAAQPELFVPGTTIEASTGPATSSEAPAGTISVGGDNTATSRRDAQIVTVPGKNYLIQFVITGGNGQVSSRAGPSQGSSSYYDATISGPSVVVTATGTALWLRWYIQSLTVRIITNISIKEVPAHYAIQATSGARPSLVQSTGLLFDGVDDNLLTDWFAQAGANCIIAQVTVPASIPSTQLITGAWDATVTNPIYVGVDTTGQIRRGVGASFVSSGADVRGQSVILGISIDVGAVKTFVGTDEVDSRAPAGSVTTAVPLRIGAANNVNAAASPFGGAIKRITFGKTALTLAQFQAIRTEWLAIN